MKKLLLLCALLISVITLSGAANRSFRTEMEQWNPIGITQAQSGPQTTNRLTAGSAILPTVATAAPSGVLRGGSTNMITFTTAKAVGEMIRLYMEYSGAVPTLSGATGKIWNRKWIDIYPTSQTVTIRGDVTVFNCSSFNDNRVTALDVSQNTALTWLDCSGNQIKGEEMTRLVNSLPNRTGKEAGTFTMVREPGLEGNICLKSDVAIAKGKNWNTQKYNPDTKEYSPYKGADASSNISFTTAKAVGEKISLYMEYSGDTPALSGASGTPKSREWVTYTLTSQTVAIQGDVTGLSCFNNQLTALDVSKNTALRKLYCYNNQLTALDVSKATKLTDLECYNNQLTALDVSQNTSLIWVSCFGNQIKGEEMTRFVNSLPDRTWEVGGDIVVVQEPGLEGNICLKSDVAIAKGKNWDTEKYNSDTKKFVFYRGAYIMSFTTAKAVGEKVELLMVYTGAAPTLSGLDGTPKSGEWRTYTLTSQTVTIRGDVTFLNCSSNQLTTLDVSKNTALKGLYCYNNQLTALDVSKNTALTELDCSKNQLTALDVSKNTALTYLDCSGNQIKGEEMTRLVNSLPNRTGKEAGTFTVVQEPAPEGNICLNSDVAIAKDKNWNTLKYKSDTKNSVPYEGEELRPDIMSFTTAKAVGEKITLYMGYSGYAPTLSGLTGTPESGKYVTYTLTSQTVTIRGDVTFLDCAINQLTALDVSKNTKLTYLLCWRNQLTALDVSKNTALRELNCCSNQLTALDVSKNTALTTLECYYNRLTTLDVSKNTALTKLDCDNNQLTALDVSKNTGLGTLNCCGNQLTALDVSKNTELGTLNCCGNQIKGEEMTRLMNSLPDRTGKKAGTFIVVQEPDLEGNICLKSDVTIAKSKNWNTLKYKTNTEEYVAYEGEEPIPYAVTLAKEGEGTITATGATDLNAVPLGTELTIEATPAEGYELTALTANGTDILAEKKFTVTAATEVKATFTKKTYAVTLTKEGEGTLTATGAEDLNAVAYGTELTIVATPTEGYELTVLTANGSDILATKKVVVTGATEVKAIFTKKTAADVVNGSSVHLYPNPAGTYVNVKGAKADALVRLYDANGSLRYEARTDADGTLQIDLSAYAEGSYLLRVGNDAKRLLIQR